MTVRRWFSIFAAAAFVMAAGCSGPAGTDHALLPGAPAQAPAARVPAKGRAVITIHVPRKRHARGIHPRYISPATAAMTLAITGPTTLNQTVNLTPTSTGCTSTVTTTNCTLTLALAAGSYTATIDTYDSTTIATAHLLSTAQNVGFTITAGTSNAIALSLSGVPVKIAVVPVGIMTAQSPSGTFDLLGTAAHSMIVQALDADGNIIFGPGAPSFAVARTQGNLNVALGQPTAASPNIFTVRPPGAFSAQTATLTITASYTAPATDGCAQSGAVCTGSVVVDMKQLLAVGNGTGANTVTIYELPIATPFATISTGIAQPAAMVFDASGNLFVGNCGTCISGPTDYVAEFAPPYTSAAINTITAVSNPQAIAVDASDDLFVASPGNSSVIVDSPPYNAPVTVNTGGQPFGVALDASNDLFVANQTTNNITAYAPPYTGAPALTISSGINVPSWVGLDGAGNLYALNQGGSGSVTEYSFPLSNAQVPNATISTGINTPGNTMAVTQGGNVFVPTRGAGSHVQVYLGPVSNNQNPTITVTNGLNNPIAVAVDGASVLYALNSAGNNVTTYNPNAYNLNLTIGGLTAPLSLAILP